LLEPNYLSGIDGGISRQQYETIVFDTEGKIQEQFRIQAYPTSYFIDSKGIIQQVIIGQLSYEDIVAMAREMK